MIQAVFTKGASGWSEMEVSGHAGSGEYGFDIVCAAVSMLTLNFANSVAVLTGQEAKLEMANEGGYLRIQRPQGLTPDQLKVWQTLFDSVLIGLKNLAENSSEYVAQPIIK
ncbi:ribosomal-processing cysteine protease Prp [Streptococcus sobrinus]|uniref:ribosomal-processing cysteine protease Prp n=1 Tax=Streptococcus sobrinus TaxID=1310 RepID=UPI000D705330|nr:ribosomal-processing cysteine protease Prp [Streptococcus sobrinus]AWN61724.1 ribosomal-processing cysteine protease Prp [Streptococcus sobrinus]AWN63595.1 ribosomal-processing cysteine protease Prp [Streptococcus sobrinus]SQG20212.1 ribosomal protein [Streptococcus sobrinus]